MKPKNKLQQIWYPILYPIHKQFWLIKYKKLRAKISGYKSTYGLEMEETIKAVYGKQCPFCDTILTVKTIGLDHSIPLVRGGENVIGNVEIMCQRCNCSKGIGLRDSYVRFLEYCETEPDKIFVAYMKRKMASKDPWGK